MVMDDLRRSLEENYLTFIALSTATVVLIGIVVWAVTIFVKKVGFR
ncbi:MAG: hypothetical protein J7M24_07080 [Candidatus Latescibacteria bacterium]|nr:hypothetical protein [Candidatus Latescibacterota bacterium]